MTDLIRNWFLDPVALLFLGSLLTLIFLIRKRQHAIAESSTRGNVAVVMVWALVFLVFSSPNIVHPLLHSLESQYPESLVCAAGSHLVVLGGGVDSRVQSRSEFERMSPSTLSRATAAARIAELEPQLRIVAAGGAGIDISEADVIASYWVALGIDDARILREGRSSNTRENALNVASLLAAESIESPLRLVTSALHMPRAVRTFRKVFDEQEIEICPVSVDREAKNNTRWWAWMPQITTLWKFDKFFHELIALGVYRIRGWI